MPETFEEFLSRREAVSNDYIAGYVATFMAIATSREPATFMPPSGVVIEGVGATTDAYADGAKMFGPQSTGRFEVLHSGVEGDLGYWTGIQHATVELKGKGEPIGMTLRTTEVFRREGGEWKLIHRHADMMKTPD